MGVNGAAPWGGGGCRLLLRVAFRVRRSPECQNGRVRGRCLPHSNAPLRPPRLGALPFRFLTEARAGGSGRRVGPLTQRPPTPL